MPFRLKILKSEKDRAKGFQYALNPPKDGEGLMFVMPYEGHHIFHMRNVSFDLDLIAVDSNGVVVDFLTMKSNDMKLYQPLFPFKYAIETRAGHCQRNGIQIGDQIKSKQR